MYSNNMISVYDELIKLHKLPNAYSEWADYRKDLSEFICSEIPAGSSVLVVGAGECNDLDLNSFISHFSSITLMDIDIGNISEGLERQKINLFDAASENAEINLLAGDIIGINETIYRELCSNAVDLVKSKGSGDNMLKLILETMEKAYNERVPYTFSDKYDYVVCCGVHSQLNNMFCQIAEVFHHYINFNMEAIFLRASRENIKIAHDLNRQLVNCSNHAVIMALETQRIGVQGAIEGAYQSLEDIGSFYCVNKEKSLIWPFDASNVKTYRMILKVVSGNVTV